MGWKLFSSIYYVFLNVMYNLYRMIPLSWRDDMTDSQASPPMVLSWYSWNWPLTKRSTKLDFPTADSPNSTSLNWQILLLAAVPLVRAGPPRPAMAQCWRLGASRVKREEVWLKLGLGLVQGLARAGWGWATKGYVQFRQVDEPEEEETSPVGAGKHHTISKIQFNCKIYQQ